MPKLDSIAPDFKKSSSNKKINKPSNFKISQNLKPKKTKKNEASKKRLMFFLILLIMIFIVVGWLFMVKEGLIFTSNKEDSGWSKIKEGFGSIANIFKGDIFEKEQETSNTNYASEEEQIKDLEERLFPEFYNINNNANINQ